MCRLTRDLHRHQSTLPLPSDELKPSGDSLALTVKGSKPHDSVWVLPESRQISRPALWAFIPTRSALLPFLS